MSPYCKKIKHLRKKRYNDAKKELKEAKDDEECTRRI
jgi:hypothetical protein